jgi:Pyridoxamine 5'-phosphate oxidase
MTDKQPSEVTNLDIYGGEPLEWSRVQAPLAEVAPKADIPYFLGTVRPDGRPHSAGVGALWHEGDLFVTSGPGTQKSRNLEANSRCTISARLPTVDVVFDGEAQRVTDHETLQTVAARYREGGWPAEVEGDAFTAPFSAPSAGPPPWYLWRIRIDRAVAVSAAEPWGATRWRFDR